MITKGRTTPIRDSSNISNIAPICKEVEIGCDIIHVLIKIGLQ
jgi:hypothetical protein